MIKIVTDSAADLPKELIEKYNINVVPLTVKIDGTEYREGVDTLAGSLGQGLQVLKAAELAAKGFTVSEIIERLKDYRKGGIIISF